MHSKSLISILVFSLFSTLTVSAYSSNSSKYLYIKDGVSTREYMCHYKEIPMEENLSALIASPTKTPSNPNISCEWSLIQSSSSSDTYLAYQGPNNMTWYVTSYNYDHSVNINLDSVLVLMSYFPSAQKFTLTPTGFPTFHQGFYLKSSSSDAAAYYIKDLELDTDFGMGYLKRAVKEQEIYKAIFFMES